MNKYELGPFLVLKKFRNRRESPGFRKLIIRWKDKVCTKERTLENARNKATDKNSGDCDVQHCDQKFLVFSDSHRTFLLQSRLLSY